MRTQHDNENNAETFYQMLEGGKQMFSQMLRSVAFAGGKGERSRYQLWNFIVSFSGTVVIIPIVLGEEYFHFSLSSFFFFLRFTHQSAN